MTRPVLIGRDGTLPNGYHVSVELWWQAEKAVDRWWEKRTAATGYEPRNRLDRVVLRLSSITYRRRKAAERRHPRARF